MAESVTVMEVSPRDGLQNESVLLDTDAKLRLIDYALAAGFRRIEVTSFAHPARVPQMADAEAVCRGLPQRGDVCYTGLVMNRRGYERLLATERLDEAGLVVPVTDTFAQRNQGMTVSECVAMARGVLRDARARGLRAQVTLAVAFGCPFEGEVPLSRLLELADALAEEEPVELALADTVGVGVPGQVLEYFAALRERLGPDLPLRAHFHDTRNTGIANAFAALQVGVETLDASLGGIGGCPFAPQATGNIATEDLVYMLDRMRVAHGVSLERLLEGAAWLETALGKPVPSRLLKSGGFPPQTVGAASNPAPTVGAASGRESPNERRSER
ncbi:MAG TPA: hydroxymethylglutaryl-CoA lyase [Pseudomonadales bacterium]